MGQAGKTVKLLVLVLVVASTNIYFFMVSIPKIILLKTLES